MFRQILTALATVFGRRDTIVKVYDSAPAVTPQLPRQHRRYRSTHTMPNKWWRRRKARLRMQRASRRINRRHA